MKNVKKDILWRVYVSFLLVSVLAVAVVLRIAWLQTVKRPQLEALADSLSTKYFNISPIRGNLYAEDGSLLATSIPIYEARFDTRAVEYHAFKEGVDSLAWYLSQYFGDKSDKEYFRELTQARKKGMRYMLIRRNLTHTQITDIRKFPIFRLGKYKGGLIAVQDSRRILPFGQLAQRTIGYSKEDIKPVGLEGAFNNYLSGTVGKRLMQRISGGAWIPINKDNEIDPEDGKDIITTIDVNFQDITEQALKKVLVDNGAEYGCAIVMEVSTGKIKAIANLTKTEEGDYQEGYNYAIGASTEPGSTFKLVTVMSLLELGKATPNSVYDTKDGKTQFYNRVMTDAKEGGHGVVTLQQAFEISSNVAISTAAFKAYANNPSEFSNFIDHLGINKPLGLPITGEGRPIIKKPHDKDWSGTTLPWMSIGYEVRLTPLQILTIYNAVANKGVMVKPQFVTEIQDAGKTVQKFDTQVLNPKVCSERTLHQLYNMMEGVVEHGTATNIKNDLFPIAGKTGTAQIADEHRGYQKIYRSSFAGFFPANNPQYSCMVMVSSPSGGAYYGALVAAPAFSEIARKIYARTSSSQNFMAAFVNPSVEPMPLVNGIRKDELSSLMSIYSSNKNLQTEPDINKWVKPTAINNQLSMQDDEVMDHTVPDVKGMVLTDAIYKLENAGLSVKFHGSGRVKNQSIAPGSAITNKQTIEIELD